ncbi:MAG: lytic transglycosylase F [Burkholderiales bacterium]|nr:lytic transglycosylase F [Burkholderiales bacterium]
MITMNSLSIPPTPSCARGLPALLAATVLLLTAMSVHAQAPSPAMEPAAGEQVRQLKVQSANKPWKGDFDQMLERRQIRVYVPYSRSLYFIDKGRERGISAELIRDFERWVNKKYAKHLGKRPLTVYIVAATRDKLLPDLTEGLADVAVGNLTVTDERLKLVDFVAPDEKLVNVEILVTGPASPVIASLDDLAGKTVHVRKASSYYESLTALNSRLKQAGKPEVKLVLVPDALEDEDMLEMMNAGLLQAIVVDDWKAKMWAQVLPKIQLREDVVLRPGTKRGWAIRKNSPQLAAELNDFYTSWAKKQGVIPYRVQQYMKTIKALNNASASDDQKRFLSMIALFEKYGQQYGFDPLMLAAQGYQESTLNQNKKSHVGAIGVMQVMPATGKELKVGDIKITEANIHAGAKYMDQLMTRYFKDADFDEQNRTLFAFASYNAGPSNIAKMRKAAEERGLDPNKWVNNVENVTAEKIGIETTTYVRNVYKYYVSYKLTEDARASTQKLKQDVTPGAEPKR